MRLWANKLIYYNNVQEMKYIFILACNCIICKIKFQRNLLIGKLIQFICKCNVIVRQWLNEIRLIIFLIGMVMCVGGHYV